MESKITSFSIACKWKSKDTIYNWQTKLQKAKFKKKKGRNYEKHLYKL